MDATLVSIQKYVNIVRINESMIVSRNIDALEITIELMAATRILRAASDIENKAPYFGCRADNTGCDVCRVAMPSNSQHHSSSEEKS